MIDAETVALIESFDGWLHTHEGERLAELASAVPAHLHIVECGSFAGRSTAWLIAGAIGGRGAAVTAVDPWGPGAMFATSPGTQLATALERLFYENMVTLQRHLFYEPIQSRLHPIKAQSIDVARNWNGETVGLLFLDGSKRPAEDIAAWAPRLAVAATVAFHDYGNGNDPEVKRDVDKILRSGGWTDLGLVGSLKVIQACP